MGRGTAVGGRACTPEAWRQAAVLVARPQRSPAGGRQRGVLQRHAPRCERNLAQATVCEDPPRHPSTHREPGQGQSQAARTAAPSSRRQSPPSRGGPWAGRGLPTAQPQGHRPSPSSQTPDDPSRPRRAGRGAPAPRALRATYTSKSSKANPVFTKCSSGLGGRHRASQPCVHVCARAHSRARSTGHT